MAAILEAMLKDLPGRFVVVWDGGPMHEGDPIRDLMGHSADRLDLERLPPYAPMLNPVEPLWSWRKWGRLSNFATKDAVEIETRVVTELAKVREDQTFLRSLSRASDLLLPSALLS
jgi:transposase